MHTKTSETLPGDDPGGKTGEQPLDGGTGPVKQKRYRDRWSYKLTPELQERLVKYLERGNYVETACALAGIHKDSFYSWLKKGRAGEKKYQGFLEAVETALAQSEDADLLLIRVASRMDWHAAAWRLERRFPKKWGKRADDFIGSDTSGVVTEERITAALEKILKDDCDEIFR